ncbi:MAG: hypothetical protein A3J94_15030 [Syntrophus sp. RIFOXYC2_FULL_54_9]|nr:MAG: hypothetical protein A3J94_15030 [Syntrophus sp. RIFOXYC2_FULL_54_9]
MAQPQTGYLKEESGEHFFICGRRRAGLRAFLKQSTWHVSRASIPLIHVFLIPLPRDEALRLSLDFSRQGLALPFL